MAEDDSAPDDSSRAGAAAAGGGDMICLALESSRDMRSRERAFCRWKHSCSFERIQVSLQLS